MRIESNNLFASIPPHTYESHAQVIRCSWSVLGGPDRALLNLADEGDGLEAYRHLLGQPVEIFAASGSKIWWGYISAIRCPHMQFPQVIDLERLANRVCAGYEELEPGSEPGQYKQTAWYENLPSQATYGVKEKFLKLGMVSLAQANQTAVRYLNDHAWPELSIEGHSLSVSQGSSPTPKDTQPSQSVELVCHGWIHQLSWRTWQTKSGMLGHAPVQVGVQKIGEAAANQRLAQSFKLEVTQDVSFIKLRLRKEGYPTDSLMVSIQSDSSGAPSGTLLASATLSPTSVSAEGYAWCQVSFAALPTLTAGVNYWLVMHRSGALNPNAYYSAGVDESASYANGVLKVYNSTSGLWSLRSPVADLLFKFGLLKDSDKLMQELFDSVAQGFSGLQMEALTGLTLAPYLREPMDGLSALKSLLALGGSDLVPLLASVNPSKLLRIYPQPEATVPAFMIDQNNVLCDHFGNKVDLESLPTGHWVQYGESQPVFIQQVTWEAVKTQLTLNY
ncbi:MAG: choice-of-anchor R domain-containing protein [Anaerolineaceae bacterium]